MLKSKHERARAHFTSPSGMIDHYVPDGKPYEGTELPVISRFNYTSDEVKPLVQDYIVLFPERKVFSGGHPIAVEMRGSWYDIVHYFYKSWEGFRRYRFYTEKAYGEGNEHLTAIRARLPDGVGDDVVAYFCGELLDEGFEVVPEDGFQIHDMRFKLIEPVADVRLEFKDIKHYYIWSTADTDLLLASGFEDVLQEHHEGLDWCVRHCMLATPDRFTLSAPKALAG